MKYEVFEQLEKVLKKDERLVAEGELQRNRAVELARHNDATLLRHLLADKKIKETFFTDVDGVQVFDSERFVRFVNNKEFLPDSYTAFKNKIGLAEGDEFISEKKEVVLNWPYKDCVLEGGQTKEDAKREEVFWNETLAPDQIHRLLDPKVFTNWKRIDTKGEHRLDKLNVDEKGDIKDNLVIKGNNLLVLHSLKTRFAGKVKLIYIDLPFNTETDSFSYNDRFDHSTWLTFIRNRLEVARELLHPEGSIFAHIDNHEAHYLKVLLDEVFGRENFRNQIVWEYSRWSTKGSVLPRFHDTIFWYSRTKKYTFNQPMVPNDDPNPSQYVSAKDDSGKTVVLKDENGNPMKRETAKEIAVGDVWSIPIISPVSKERIGFNTQKPERLIRRILEMGSSEGDLVLDFFAGSGTTAAVAQKLGRQWIVAEQIDDQMEKLLDRIQRVTKGDGVGISKEVGWKGGGDFVYAELMPLAEDFKEKVKKSKKKDDLEKIWKEIGGKGFLSYKVDLKKYRAKDFTELSLADKKRFICDSLDYNQLYVNYSEIDDKDYRVSTEDKRLNKDFYGAK